MRDHELSEGLCWFEHVGEERRLKLKVSMCPDRGCEKGSMVLHADAVDYNENTHEIDAHGDVRIEPFRSQSQQLRPTEVSPNTGQRC
jgi:hypothetical protein